MWLFLNVIIFTLTSSFKYAACRRHQNCQHTLQYSWIVQEEMNVEDFWIQLDTQLDCK